MKPDLSPSPNITQAGRSTPLPNRRSALGMMVAGLGGSLAGAPLLSGYAAPYVISSEAERPSALWGTMVSEVTPRGAIIWSRADHPSEMMVTWSVDPDFKVSETLPPAQALPETDFTARVLLQNLPSGRRIFYRVHFESLRYDQARSVPLFGEFSTPPSDRLSPVRVAWSGDSFGQGYGINPQIGGLQIYDHIRRASPDLFIHCGDRIYADQPLKPVKGGGKGRWYNLLPHDMPALTSVAQELNDFRTYYRYGHLDQPTRHFAQLTSQLFLWDDHEVKNDWWPGRVLKDRRYKERSCDVLASRSRRAFFEYSPLPLEWARHQRIYRKVSYGPNLEIFALDSRSYRGPNDREAHLLNISDRRSQFFGPQQLKWLCEGLKRSKARWKVIACPQPLGLVIGSGGRDFDGISSGEREPRGRELELRQILRSLYEEGVHNVVWVSADVHYAAAHHFHPDRAVYRPFLPFWEFIAGPLNAATLRPHRLDPTFGPRRAYLSIPEDRSGRGRSPLYGEQYFGLLDVLEEGTQLKVSIYNLAGERLFIQELRAT